MKPAVPRIPPLENGDRLTREEFELRFDAMPGLKRAELIEGVVFIQMPVRVTTHGAPQAKIIGLIGNYSMHTPGVRFACDSTLRLDLDNEPQPDGILFIQSSCGGRSVIEDGYIAGSPELVIEVAACSASMDLFDKKKAYRRNGVPEYIVWRTMDDAIDYFILRGSQYEWLEPDDDGITRSKQFPGLWLDIPAILADDLLQADATLRRGLESAEHAAFVAKLRAAKGS